MFNLLSKIRHYLWGRRCPVCGERLSPGNTVEFVEGRIAMSAVDTSNLGESYPVYELRR